MKATEIREMTVEEMNEKLLTLKDELFRLRFQLAVGKQENTARVQAVRKDIARVKTCLREAESAK